MAVVAQDAKLTYEDILSLGETNQRIELFDGVLVMSAMPNPEHQGIATDLAALLREYVKRKQIGKVYGAPIDVKLSADIVLQPDVWFLSNERKHINDGKRLLEAPDLVVEILSESTQGKDRTYKLQHYALGGAREYWIVSPEKKEIEVFQNVATAFRLIRIFGLRDTLSSALFPGLDLPVVEVFSE